MLDITSDFFWVESNMLIPDWKNYIGKVSLKYPSNLSDVDIEDLCFSDKRKLTK